MAESRCELRRQLVVVVMAFMTASACRGAAPELDLPVFPIAISTVDAGIDAGPPEEPPQVHATGCWSAPIVVSKTWVGVALVGLPNGDALLVWLDLTSAAAPRVLSRVLSPDGGLGAIQQLYTAPTPAYPGQEQLSIPSLHLNAEGAIATAWTHRGDGGQLNEILVARRRVDAGWLPVERINPDTTLQVGDWADVKTAGDGRLFAAWMQRPTQGEPGGVHVRRFEPDAGWGTGWVITPTRTVLQAEPALHANDEGAAAVTWEGYSPNVPPALHATWVHGAQPDDELFERGGPPAFSFQPDGGAVMAWTGDPDVHSARFAANAWGPLETFGGDAGAAIGPMALDTFEPETAIWAAGDPSLHSMWLAQHSVAGWTEPRRLDVVNHGGSHFLLHASNGQGRRLVSWQRGMTMVVMHPDGGMDTIEGLAVIDVSRPPHLAVAGDGTAWIVATVQEPEFREVALVCPASLQ